MSHQLAISTYSMGWHPSHTFERKVQAARNANVKGFELYNIDLNNYAKLHSLTRMEAAEAMSNLCRASGVTILAYGSFDNFEGNPTPLSDRLDTAKEWLQISKILGTQVIQIPANDQKDALGDDGVIVAELQALADLGQRQTPPVAFAYEALAWSTHIADWEESLRIVQLVDRPNFGLCLDTYHVLARLWADPASPDGRRPGGASSLRDSLQRFRDTCPREKIIYVQLSDGERADPPILPGHPAYRPEKHSTQSWCMHGRIFPYEEEYGAYLPLDEILRGWLIESEWSGWVSMEVFHHSMDEENIGPEIWAERARKSWNRVLKVLKK